MTTNKSKVLACATVIEEMLTMMPVGYDHETLDFGLPALKYVNRTFLTLAMYAGLDSAILDPLNPEMIRTILATELTLGRDRFAQKYSKAYRAGMLT